MKNEKIFECAKNCLSLYDGEDFKSVYRFFLVEDTHAIEAQVKRILQRENNYAAGEMAKEVTEYILENHENNVLEFSGIHVGDMCVGSVEFGEQHVSFKSLGIPEDKWKQAAVIFESLDFMVNEGDAYFIVDGGLKIDLDSFIEYDNENNCFKTKFIFH